MFNRRFIAGITGVIAWLGLLFDMGNIFQTAQNHIPPHWTWFHISVFVGGAILLLYATSEYWMGKETQPQNEDYVEKDRIFKIIFFRFYGVSVVIDNLVIGHLTMIKRNQ